MNAPNILWPLAFDSWGEEEVEAACAVIRSRRLTMGERVAEFERAFADHLGMRYAVMANSGSSANLLAVAALSALERIKPGDEAVVPAIAWPTTYAPLAQHGLRLSVVDVDPLMLNAPVEAYEAAITDRTKLLVGASILGNPADVDLLRALADRRGLWFLEDNCESLGAKVGFGYTGTFGHAGTFSFFFSHHLSTGEGGMLVTDDRELYKTAVCLRAHGWTRDLLNTQSESAFDRPYEFVRPGYNLRPMEIAGAVGLVQLRRLETRNEERQRNADAFTIAFGLDERFFLQHPNPRGRWAPFGFPMTFRSMQERDAAARAIQASGIECRLITGGSFFRHQAARWYDWRRTPNDTPHADAAHDRGLFVGNAHFPLGEERLEALASAINKGVPK